MSKPWYASFKRAAVYGGVSILLALSFLEGGGTFARAEDASEPTPTPSETARAPLPADLPERTITLASHDGKPLRVGDSVAYSLDGGDPNGEARWQIDPKESGLKLGFLFRPGHLFTPLAAGELSLPPLAIIDESGTRVAKTKDLKITIGSNFSEKERSSGSPPKPEPAIGPTGLPFPAWVQSTLALLILGVVLLGVLFLVRVIRKKTSAALKKMIPKKPYDQAALEQIDLLSKKGFLEKGAFKPFYFGISETLKFYFGERYDFDAQESTTSELIVLLGERSGTPGLDDKVIRRIQTLFNRLDPVKFADVIPAQSEALDAQKEARDLILATRKRVEPILSKNEKPQGQVSR